MRRSESRPATARLKHQPLIVRTGLGRDSRFKATNQPESNFHYRFSGIFRNSLFSLDGFETVPGHHTKPAKHSILRLHAFGRSSHLGYNQIDDPRTSRPCAHHPWSRPAFTNPFRVDSLMEIHIDEMHKSVLTRPPNESLPRSIAL